MAAGIAEIAAGSIAMGLGGYLAAHGDAEHYHNERFVKNARSNEKPEAERQEVAEVLEQYGLEGTESTSSSMRSRSGRKPGSTS